MTRTGLHTLSALALRRAFEEGRASVVAATDHYLERIARLDPRLCAFNDIDAAGARAAAQASAARIEAGEVRPLEGVPVAIKANIAVAGLPWHGGIGAFRDRIAGKDAEVVRRLREAGAIILGTTNLHEGALGATTANPHFGVTVNPHGAGLTAGGSSGGSGAAVAAGLCALALGTDTLGSIRIPASYCGVYGLKPTNGLVPDDGLFVLKEEWDCIGPMARSVEDLALAMDVLAPVGPAGAPATRVATLSSAGVVACDRDVWAAVRLAADLLEGSGVAITEMAAAIDYHRVRLAGFVEAARAADRALASDIALKPDGFSDAFRASLAFGQGFREEAREEGLRALEAAAAAVRATLQVADAILLPTTPQAAFPHAGPAPVSQADFTALANVSGVPAISIPAGWTGSGLPVGVQLLGRPGGEADLIALALRLDLALNGYRPPASED
jgi:aspartyl-tRNA(Asn)/glutamyl-tRNA(Gln) amidotransferase subunit A